MFSDSTRSVEHLTPKEQENRCSEIRSHPGSCYGSERRSSAGALLWRSAPLFLAAVRHLRDMRRDIDGKVCLSVLEAGWLLGKTEGEIRGMLTRGELAYAVIGKKILGDSVAGLLATGLQQMLLRSLLAGRVIAPKPERRHGPPASLWDGLDQLILASPTLMVNPASGQTRIVPSGFDTQGTHSSLIPVIAFAM